MESQTGESPFTVKHFDDLESESTPASSIAEDLTETNNTKEQDSLLNSQLAPQPSPCVQLQCSDLAKMSTYSLLSDEQKYQILTAKPCQLSEYPLNKQKRRFLSKWAVEYPWIRYSESADGVFCAACYLFSKIRVNTEFVSSPFRDWKNATDTSCGALHRHSSSHNHIQCHDQAVTFIAVMKKKVLSIKSQLNSTYEIQIQQNTQALLAIVDVIQFLTKQGIALRGHNWNSEERREDGHID